MRFSQSDRDVLQGLAFDSKAKPSFELMKECLVWPDEFSELLSKDGYSLLADLWIVRGFIHRALPTEQWGLDPAYFQQAWNEALKDVPGWPGFRRMHLDDVDREYLSHGLAEASTSDDY